MDRLKILNRVIWFCAALFFLYEFTLRILPEVMIFELMHTFRVEAAALGNLSAFYFYVYAPMQLPVGILVDRFGAKRLLAKAIYCCSLGALLFGLATHLWVAELARMCMGLGSAFAFVSMLYISSHTFTAKHVPIAMGVGNSFGMVGAAIGEGPFSVFTKAYGWRLASLSLGCYGFMLGLIVTILYWFSPSRTQRTHRHVTTVSLAFTSFKQVCANRLTWLNALICLSFYATTAAFAGLWAVPFLQTAYQLSAEKAGFAVSLFYLGWLFGGPLIGFVTSWTKRIKPLIILSALLAFTTLTPIIYLTTLSTSTVFCLLFATGFFSAAQLLTFRYAIEINPATAKGSALAITNFTTMLGGAFLQPLVGYLLEWDWSMPTAHLQHRPNYALIDFQYALLVFPLTFLLTALLTLFLSEKARVKDVTYLP